MTDRFDEMARAILTGETTSASAMKAVAAALRSVDAKARLVVDQNIARPYPEGVFTPLSDQEVEQAVAAIQSAIGRTGSDRLHAQWARHLSKVRIDDLERALQPEAGAPGTQKEESR